MDASAAPSDAGVNPLYSTRRQDRTEFLARRAGSPYSKAVFRRDVCIQGDGWCGASMIAGVRRPFTRQNCCWTETVGPINMDVCRADAVVVEITVHLYVAGSGR
jgi:hypothetical protein